MQCYEKLNDIENFLKEKNILFYRIHQSFLVNPSYVKKYRYDMIELLDGTEFTISEKRRKSVNEVFCKIKGEELMNFNFFVNIITIFIAIIILKNLFFYFF